jgi:membrane-associated phospholipid phosphatase
VLLYTFFFLETGLLNRMFFPEYLDATVIRWEQALFGCQPSVLFMDKLPCLAISELFYAAYFSYYVMIAGVGIALFFRSRLQFHHYISVISFVFYVCYTLYIIFPVVGPPVLFNRIPGYELPADLEQLAAAHRYPEAVTSGPFFWVMALLYRLVEGPGAAIPSSHVAIALCTVYFSFRYLSRIRYPHLAVAILLCLSTVYCRYHYVLDVLAGVLTTAFLVPVANLLYNRFSEPPAKAPGPTPPGNQCQNSGNPEH